jgi:hypothetical protein
MTTYEGSLLAEIRKLGGERETLSTELDDVTRRLAEAAVKLVEVGVSEKRR